VIKRQRVLIFGLSYHGRAVHRMLDRRIYNIIGFIENDIDKIGGKFADTNIFHTKNLNHINFDKVIVSGRNIDDMIRQLRDEFIIDREKIKVMERSDLVLKSSALEKKEKKLCEMLHYFVNLSSNLDIDYWMGYSSLLALKRGEEFAKFSDIDICIMSEHIPLFFEELIKDSKLYDITTDNYQSDSKYWKKGDISSITISEKIDVVISEPAKIDIMALSKYNDKVFVPGSFDKMYSFPFSYFDGCSKISRFNIDISVPVNAKEYLRIVYGDNWNTPVERWQHRNYKSLNLDQNITS
jgi:phosphorylcholine metabolism protein LicD